MKHLFFVFYLLLSINSLGQNNSKSIYFEPFRSDLNKIEVEKILNQGKFFSIIDVRSKIVFMAYSTADEYKNYGDQLLMDRINVIKDIFINDCYLDSSRFIYVLIGDKIAPNINPLTTQRVDIEPLN